MSSSWLFSAFAIADSSVFLTAPATRFRENESSAIALSTFLPRIAAATRLSFCGLTRRLRPTAIASVGLSERLRFGLPMGLTLRRRRSRGCLGLRRSRRASLSTARFVGGGRRRRLAGGGMADELPRRRKLTELVANHVLRHQHGNVLGAVMDLERQADELRQNGRAAAPGLDRLVPARSARGLGFLQQIPVHERALPY